jgi:hypothetical protein
MSPVIAFWFASLPAGAQSLVWEWPAGTVRTWRIDVVVGYSNPIWLKAQNNIEGRAERVLSQQIWTCQSIDASRTGWELACTIDDVRLVVQALEGEEAQIEIVVAELDAALTGAVVQLQLDRNGHLRAVDLEGIAKDGRRSSAIHETLRLLVARSAAGFDQHLPLNGDLKQTWKQRDDLLYAYPVSYGSLSGARVTHTLGDHNDRHVTIQSVGRGTVRIGETHTNSRDLIGNEDSWMLDLASDAQALFDGLDGHLAARRWVVVGRPISSSGWQVGKPVKPYTQSGRLERLAPTSPAKPLGASGLWSDESEQAAMWQQLLSSPLWQEAKEP